MYYEIMQKRQEKEEALRRIREYEEALEQLKDYEDLLPSSVQLELNRCRLMLEKKKEEIMEDFTEQHLEYIIKQAKLLICSIRSFCGDIK